MLRALSLPDGEVAFDATWLEPDEADLALAAIRDEVPWRQDAITLFGRSVLQPRLSAWMGDPAAVYTYSGLTLAPVPWTPAVLRILDRARATVGEPFNSVLLNYYRDGSDSMGLHADDEPELGPAPRIASVSLGETRRFVLKPKKKAAKKKTNQQGSGGEPVSIELTHGSLLVMAGATQRAWVHGVPKTARELGARINLTFRRIFPR